MGGRTGGTVTGRGHSGRNAAPLKSAQCGFDPHRGHAIPSAGYSPRSWPDRGPLLIISGEKDNTVPWAVANASYKQQKDNPGLTEIIEIKGRGHALTIDSGWREVADTALAFIKRNTQ